MPRAGGSLLATWAVEMTTSAPTSHLSTPLLPTSCWRPTPSTSKGQTSDRTMAEVCWRAASCSRCCRMARRTTIGVYIGGSGSEVCAAVLGTPEGAVLVVGSTNSPDFGSPAAGPGGFATLLEPPGRSGKVGDCNLDGDVTVSDVITAVNIGLGLAPLTRCQRAGVGLQRHRDDRRDHRRGHGRARELERDSPLRADHLGRCVDRGELGADPSRSDSGRDEKGVCAPDPDLHGFGVPRRQNLWCRGSMGGASADLNEPSRLALPGRSGRRHPRRPGRSALGHAETRHRQDPGSLHPAAAGGDGCGAAELLHHRVLWGNRDEPAVGGAVRCRNEDLGSAGRGGRDLGELRPNHAGPSAAALLHGVGGDRRGAHGVQAPASDVRWGGVPARDHVPRRRQGTVGDPSLRVSAGSADDGVRQRGGGRAHLTASCSSGTGTLLRATSRRPERRAET